MTHCVIVVVVVVVLVRQCSSWWVSGYPRVISKACCGWTYLLIWCVWPLASTNYVAWWRRHMCVWTTCPKSL